MPPHPDAIADCVIAAFRALPLKAKPRVYPDGRREWVPLAGIVLSRDISCRPSNLTCVALATGMKCLPRAKLTSARGNALHDWHAEVLALRGFSRWLVDECADLAHGEFPTNNTWLQRRNNTPTHHPDTPIPPFQLHPDVSVHMYCSEAPCGDASMELTMAEQDDATPWSTTTLPSAPFNHPPNPTAPPQPAEMLGRGHFDQLGIVRRKPSRADAPITGSKSCSDKLALKQCTGVANALVDFILSPVHLETLVLPRERCVPEAVERSWGATGRMRALAVGSGGGDQDDGTGYVFRPFRVVTTERRFEFEKEKGAKASNLAVLATPRRMEVLINGVLQGRRISDIAGASSVSRRRLWEAVNGVLASTCPAAVMEGDYGKVKDSAALARRRQMKEKARALALKPWIRNAGDEGWSLQNTARENIL